MMHEALIRFAPETSAKRLNDPSRNGRALYDTTRLRMLPSQKTIPLVEDHDLGKELGRVTDLMRFQDVDGWWLCAVASLEKCPSWLKRGTRASFQFRELQHDTFGHNIVRAAIVSEVSVLSPGVEPYEPLAQVLYVKPIEPKPAAMKPARSEVLTRHEVSRRYVGRDLIVDMSDGTQEMYHGARRDRPKSSSSDHATGVAFGHGEMLPPAGGRIIRPGIGSVLGVR